jgi:site-specific recombinase XerD
MDDYVANRKRAGVKNTTIHRELTDIMAILNWSVSRRYISHNPLAGYKKPKRDDAVIQPPTKAEAERLFNVAAPHLKRFIALSYFAGIRPGSSELLQIPWSAVDWDMKTLFVESAKKNGIASRTIPLHSQLFELLATWHKEDRKWALKKGQQLPLTIIHYRGRKIQRIKTAFNNAKRKAMIKRRLRPYDFRHAFATIILAGRGDLKATSELLGHTRTDTTIKIYQHINPDMHREAVDLMPKMDLSVINVLTKKNTVTN